MNFSTHLALSRSLSVEPTICLTFPLWMSMQGRNADGAGRAEATTWFCRWRRRCLVEEDEPTIEEELLLLLLPRPLLLAMSLEGGGEHAARDADRASIGIDYFGEVQGRGRTEVEREKKKRRKTFSLPSVFPFFRWSHHRSKSTMFRALFPSANSTSAVEDNLVTLQVRISLPGRSTEPKQWGEKGEERATFLCFFSALSRPPTSSPLALYSLASLPLSPRCAGRQARVRQRVALPASGAMAVGAAAVPGGVARGGCLPFPALFRVPAEVISRRRRRRQTRREWRERRRGNGRHGPARGGGGDKEGRRADFSGGRGF